MRERFTKRLLDRLAADFQGRSLLAWDTEVPGLVLRLRSGCAPVFAYQYKLHGRQRRLSIGGFGPLTLEQARDRARDLYAAVKDGRDPLADRQRGRTEAERRAASTVEAAARAYLADLEERVRIGAKRGRQSTLPEWRRLVERKIIPSLGSIELEALESEDVERWHRTMHQTPATANRALTVLSAVLRFAEKRKLRPRGSNPCSDVEDLLEHPRRTRTTTAHLVEIGERLRTAEAEGTVHPSAALALRLLALTGMRRSEVLGHGEKARRSEGDGLRWGDVDFATAAIRLRKAKAGERLVPLGAATVTLLQSVSPADVEPEVLVCPGERPGQPFVGIDKVRLRLGLVGGLHSLRRGFASIAAEKNFGEFVIAALLGHGKASITADYVRLADDPLGALWKAADAVAGEVAAALDGRPPAGVVRLPSTIRPER